MFKEVSKISILNGGAQLISIFGFIVTSREYGLYNIGVLSIVNAFTMIISTAACGYFEQIFFIEKRRNIQNLIMPLILYFNIGLLILSGLVLIVFNINYVIFILLNIFSNSILKITSTLSIIENKIIQFSLIKFLNAPIIPITAYIFQFFFLPKEISLIFIYCGGNLLLSFILIVIYRRYFYHLKFYRHTKGIKKLFFRYIHFIKYNLSGEVLRSIAFRAPTIVISAFFNKEIAGLYSITNQIIITPITVIGGAISQAFTKSIIQNNLGTTLGTIKKLIKTLSILSFCGILGVLLSVEHLVQLLLGPEYSELPTFLKLILPYGVSLFISTPFLILFTLYENQKHIFHLKVIILLCSLFSFSIGVSLNNIKVGLGLFYYSTAFVYLFYLYKAINLKTFKSNA